MAHRKEAVGATFDLDAMRFASAQSWRAIDAMVAMFKPGMRQSAATRLANRILRDLGAERLWHPTQVRFGSNTTKTFRERPDGDPMLAIDDIYFIDIGPVFEGHEGDVGATFVTGGDPEHVACSVAAKAVFDDVRDHWRRTALSGPALYEYAERAARERGWTLNQGVQGHRVGDFPHAIHRGGKLGGFDATPIPGVWILEIQIAHPNKPFGAFHEDLLI